MIRLLFQMTVRLIVALVRLAVLVGAGVAFAAFLLAVGGPPRLPDAWPTGEEIVLTLQTGGIPNQVLRSLLTQALWLLLGYLVLLVVLEIVVTVLEAIAGGGRRAMGVRGATDRLAPAIVRRAIAGVVGTMLVLGTLKPAPSIVAAPVAISRPVAPEHPSSLPTSQPALPVTKPAAPTTPTIVVGIDGTLRSATRADQLATEPGAVVHRVVTGDNLADLALRFYGDATAWPTIWEANANRIMPGGRLFDDPRLIHPGDVLVIPARPEARPVQVITQVVRPGDTLQSIARRHLGDPAAWPIIFANNQGRPAPNGMVLTDPDLIWLGMALRIPKPVVADSPPLASPATRTAEQPTGPATPAEQQAERRTRQAEAEAASEASAIARRAAAALTPPVAPAGTAAPATARPALDPIAEVAATREAWARRQAEIEAEARANAAAAGITPAAMPAASEPPPTPVNEPVSDAAAGPPAPIPTVPAPVAGMAADGAPMTPETGQPPEPEPAVTPAPMAEPTEIATPIGGVDLPLAGLAATAALLAGTLGYRALRRRLAASRVPDARLLPFHLPATPSIDPATGLADQPMAPLAGQRQRGVAADPRHAVTGRVLDALARAGWPDARVVSLTAGQPQVGLGPTGRPAERLTFRLRLGGPPPVDLEPLLTTLDDLIDATIDAELGERDELRLTLRDLSPEQAWQAGHAPPSAPLATIGLTGEGLLSINLDALDGGLLIAGQDAGPALERALLSLVALYPPADLRVVLLAGSPLAANLADLPHLLEPPTAPDTPEAPALLKHVRDRLRDRRAAMDATDAGELIVLVIDEAAALDGPALREVVRDGGEVGIYALLASADPAGLERALLDGCPGRLVTRLADDEAGIQLAGRADATALAPGAGWWRLTGESAVPLRLLRATPDDRRALLDGMRAAITTATPASKAPANQREQDTDAEATPSTDHAGHRDIDAIDAPMLAADQAGHHGRSGHQNGDHGSNGHHGRLDATGLAALPSLAAAPVPEPAASNGHHEPVAPDAQVEKDAFEDAQANTSPMPANSASIEPGDSSGTTATIAEPVLEAAADTPETGAFTATSALGATTTAGTVPNPIAEAALAPSFAPVPATLPDDRVDADPPDAVDAALDEIPPTPTPTLSHRPHGPQPGLPTFHLFGEPHLVDGQGQPIDLGRGHLARKLVLFLAIQGPAGAIAERLHAAVWARLDVEDESLYEDDDAQTRAVAAVHKAIARLRTALAPHLPPGVAAIICRGGVFRLDPAAIWTDAAAFTACVEEARRLPDPAALPLLRAALDYYVAPLAQAVPANWFDPVWLDQERAHYAEEARRAALWAGAILARGGDLAGAATTFARLRELFIVDDEAAERELICQALRGEPSLVERSYAEHTAALKGLGMQAHQTTTDLFKHVLAGPVTAEMRQRIMTTTRR